MSASSLSESGNPNRRSRETDGNAGTQHHNLKAGEGPVMCRAFLLVGGAQ